jgi:hypothetical protein
LEIPNALPTFAADQTVADRYGRAADIKKPLE